MIYVKETNPDTFERITEDITVGEGDSAITHPVGNLPLYSSEDLAAIGVIPVEPARLPLDHYEISRGSERIDGKVVEVIESALTPIRVPNSVTRVQAKIALEDAGLLDAVLAAVYTSDDRRVGIWFTDADSWERENPYVLGLASGLGLTGDQVDGLFLAAAKV